MNTSGNMAQAGGFVLENSVLRVELSVKMPVVERYLYKPTGGELLGGIPRREFVVEIYKGMEPVPPALLQTCCRAKPGRNQVVYTVTCSVGGEVAASFELAFALDASGVSVSFSSVFEGQGYYLMSLWLRGLAPFCRAETAQKWPYRRSAEG